MGCKARRGLTIIELLFALFVVFIAVSSLAGVMVSTYAYFHRLQDRTSSVQLADQGVRENLWSGAGGDFSAYAELAGFGQGGGWWYDFPSYSSVYGNMAEAHITATTPAGDTIELERGWHDFGQGGLAVRDDGKVGYGMYYNGAETIGIWDDAAGTFTGYPKMPVRRWDSKGNPIPPNPGGMVWQCKAPYSYTTNSDILYVSDTGDGGTYPIKTPLTTQAWLGNPTGPGSRSLALDDKTNPAAPVVYGDDTHELWTTSSSTLGTDPGGSGPPPITPLPPAVPLGSVGFVTMDPNDSTSYWVTDEKFMCIRHWVRAGATPSNNWDPYEYKIAAGNRMGCPVLITMASVGGVSTLIVYDGVQIWQFPSPAGGVLTPGKPPCVLNTTLTGQLHAIGWNGAYAAGDWVFFTDDKDHLWRYSISANAMDASYRL